MFRNTLMALCMVALASGPALAATASVEKAPPPAPYKKVSELVNVALTMPPDGGGIQDDQYLELVAFILQRNGAVAGNQPLTAGTSALIGDIATGVAPPAAAQP